MLVLIFFSAGSYARAELTQRLSRLVDPHDGRVGVAFIDLKTGQELSLNGSSEYPAASVAKIAVMAAAYSLANAGVLDLDQKIWFRESDKLGGSGVLQWMRGGRAYTIRNLIRLMIVLSDNTATKLLVDHIGMPQINAYLKSSGIEHSSITDPTMLKEPPAFNNNRTTPLDMAHLLVKIYRSEGFSLQGKREMLSFMRNQRYRWGLWRGVPPGTVIADKTGNLEGILNDVGIVYTKSGNYVLSVFTQGFKKQREARKIINELSRATYEEYTGEKVVQKQVKSKKPKKITKRKLWRRPSVKYQRRSGRRGAASGHKLRTYRRR